MAAEKERSDSAVLLDVTRTISRIGGGPATGIDRVEHAYLRHVAAGERRPFGLCRTRLGFILIDRPGLRALLRRLDGDEPWGKPDVWALISGSGGTDRARAEADLRHLSVARAPKSGLRGLVSRMIVQDATYLNVGHSNLSGATLSSLQQIRRMRIVCLVHDVIPLSHPETQRPGTSDRFRQKMSAVSAYADLVVTSAQATRQSVDKAMSRFGRVPPSIALPFGIDPLPSAEQNHPAVPSDRPYFVCVGTLDPRKGIEDLLGVWTNLSKRLGSKTPHLYLVGRRGWGPSSLHDRLDALRHGDLPVIEINDLDDTGRAALLRQAVGAVQPSPLEGFGFPVHEALAAGKPVIAPDLPVYRECLGELPVYAAPGDLYHWEKAIEQLFDQCQSGTKPTALRYASSSWEGYFAALWPALADNAEALT